MKDHNVFIVAALMQRIYMLVFKRFTLVVNEETKNKKNDSRKNFVLEFNFN